MWQRAQTIFLAITALCMFLMIFFPIWGLSTGTEQKVLYPLHHTITQGDQKVTNYFPYALTAVLAIAAATLAVMEITRYTNRMLQIKMGALNSLLMAGALGSSVYFATKLINENGMAGQYGYAMYLPAVALVSNLIANRFIRKDEKLVRDSNRLR